MEHAQPPRQRQRAVVRGAQRHPGARRSSHRAAPHRHPAVLPRVAGRRRPPVLAFLGERALLVGGPRPPQRPVRALRRPQARHAKTDAPHRAVPRHPNRRGAVGRDRRVLLVRVDEAERHQERPPGWSLLGRRRPGVHKQGTNGRWAETLTPKDVAEYEARAVRELGPECARWLATGEGL